MVLNMTDSNVVTVDQITGFRELSGAVSFSSASRKEKYSWINSVLTRFGYARLRGKKDKGTIKAYIQRMTGISGRQLKRLITRKRKTGVVALSPKWGAKNRFQVVYGPAEVLLLAETDNLHLRLNAHATKKILEAELAFGDERFARLAGISASHIYNLRRQRVYESHATTFTSTDPVSAPIGTRQKPRSMGRPGYLRVDTVHQGDLGGEKGVYHLNLVDEVTQWEMVFCVETICERDLSPIFERLQELFPFVVLNFHSDNGSENINHAVAGILERLRIRQTKSRSRHCNDNALVESKNGSVIRKHMGRSHIPRVHARAIDAFYQAFLNPYLNFHRPCGFSTDAVDRRGKVTKRYDTYLTPYGKLKTLDGWERYLAPGWTAAGLEQVASSHSHNGWAKLVAAAKLALVKNINRKEQPVLPTAVRVPCLD
jgi:transposase InsO family protein